MLIPGQFDERWHMFCHGFYDGDFTPYLHHFMLDDGYKWVLNYKKPFNVNPVFLFHEGDEWILYYSAVLFKEPGAFEKYGCVNIIRAMRSRDLENWSEPVDILTPSLPWELEHDETQKNFIEVRNPCMIKLPDGRFRLYYSAGTVKLHDCGYEEPKYIGCAEADSPLGPFKKRDMPLISPDSALPHRNYGAGAIKVYSCNGAYIALYNSIYLDSQGCSRSAINVLMSEDGISFSEASYNPIIVPSGAGWKKDLVYQLDLVRFGDELRLYYNVREGTADGIERIGVSIINDTQSNIHKLWDIG